MLLLLINLVDDDPEHDDPEDGVLTLLPLLASTFLIGRTTLPAGDPGFDRFEGGGVDCEIGVGTSSVGGLYLECLILFFRFPI